MLVVIAVEKGLRIQLEKFLYAKLKVRAVTKGEKILFDAQIDHKEARRLIKRFLHESGMEKGHRVLSTPEGFVIRTVIMSAKRRGGKEVTAPPPSKTLPYFFP